MSGSLVDRITVVVDEHWPSGGGNFCEGCDWRNDQGGTWAGHVAERVAAELRLHEEWTLHCFAGSVDTYRSRAAAEARWGDREALKIRGDGPLAVRYVSSWERAE